MTIISDPLYDMEISSSSIYKLSGEIKNKTGNIQVFLYNRSGGTKVNVSAIIDVLASSYQIAGDSSIINPTIDYFVVGLDTAKVVNGTVADLPTVNLYGTPVYEY